MDVSVRSQRTVSDAPPTLSLSGVSKRFGDVVALNSASLQLTAGTVHALLGENGAGKTTLMRVAFGMFTPDAGSIQVDGHAAYFQSPADAIARGIRMVHQHFALVAEMSALENFALGGHGRFDVARTAQQLTQCTAELGVAIDPGLRVSAMSVAEQQQLEVAKALSGDCRVLILDEPTSLLAPAQADALLRWTRAFVESGRSVVLITHKLRDALAVADEVTVLRHGRTALSGRVSSFRESDLLRAMLGSATAERVGDVTSSDTPHAVIARLNAVRVEDPVHRDALLDVSLDVRRGETVGVAGLERSGHRLLLRVLSGRRAVTSGSVQLPAHVAFVPEDVRLEAIADTMDLSENVAIRGAAQRSGWFKRDLWAAETRRLMIDFDIRATSERVAAETLSGGNQQRLVLARELAGEPSLIVAENPTHGLDVRATDEVHQRLRAARERGVGVVLYSSDVDELVSECDRVLVMYAGRLTAVQRSAPAIGRALLGTSSV